MNRRFVVNNQGQSLIQLLVSIVISIILLFVLVTLNVNQQRETKALTQKLGAMDLEKLLVSSLADGKVCAYVLNHPGVTFDSTNLPQTITLAGSPGQPAALYTNILPGPTPGPVAVQVGTTASPLSNSLVVKSIQLQITSGSNGRYSSRWIINFDTAKEIRPLRPVSISNVLIVDDQTSPTAATITACQASPSGAGRFQQLVFHYPGEPPGGGFIALPQASYPTSPQTYGPETLSLPQTFVPQGTRVELILQVGAQRTYTDVGQILAIDHYVHYQPAGGADTVVFVGNSWSYPSSTFTTSAGGDYEYTISINVTPGVSLTLAVGENAYCDSGCPNASTAMFGVWSPVTLLVQEYY